MAYEAARQAEEAAFAGHPRLCQPLTGERVRSRNSHLSPSSRNGSTQLAGVTGEMAALVFAKDWAATPLGPINRWPVRMRALVDMLLAHPFPTILLWGPELIQIYNDGYRIIAADKHPEALGQPTRQCWPESWHINGPIYDKVVREGQSIHLEDQLIPLARRGILQDAWFTLSYSPVTNDDGQVGGVLITVFESTDKVLAERARRKAESDGERLLRELEAEQTRLTEVFNRSPSFMALLRGPDHVVELANEPYSQLVGHRHIIGKPIRQAIPEVEQQGFVDLLDRVYTTGEPFVGSDRRVRLQRKSGAAAEDRYLDFVYQAIRHADGTISGVLVYGIDLTDRKRGERALRDSELRFRQLADAMPQMVFAAQPDGTVDYFNRRWYEYTGLPAGEASYESWKHVHTEEGLRRTMKVWPEAVRSGHAYEIEYRLRRADGEYRWHLGRALPVRDESGNIVRWFGTNTDIHDFKELLEQNEQLLESEHAARAEAEAANDAKDHFLAKLSHELRTPLMPVLLTTSLLESREDLPERLRQDVEMIRRNVELEARLIDDLLDLTRITSGKMSLEMQTADVHALLQSAVDICFGDDERYRPSIALNAGDYHVHGDPARLQQVFWNLLNNARKFTPPEGSISIATADAEDSLRIEISDTGAGIAADVLPGLFTAFEQGGEAIARRFGGLGLGLAISRALITAHGGAISASSEGAGEGAVFTVTLPAMECAPAPLLASKDKSDGEPMRLLRILLVEDDETTLDVMQKLLSSIGHDVTSTSSVRVALMAAEAGHFDLLISDLGLRDGSGYDVMRAMRGQNRTVGVAISGYGMEEDVRKSREAGFTEHITKPIDFQRLNAVIAKVTAEGLSHCETRNEFTYSQNA